MILKFFILPFLFTFFLFGCKAKPSLQSHGSDFQPANAKIGKCYAKCIPPDQSQKAEWYEVVCENYITQELVDEISSQLQKNGYKLKTKQTDILAQLADYQQANKLPVGSINYITLAHLGVYPVGY